MVLYEPNSNLDEEGEASLKQAVLNLKRLESTVILVTHKPDILSLTDNIMLLQDGRITLCGARRAVLERLAGVRSAQREQTRSVLRKSDKNSDEPSLEKDVAPAEVEVLRPSESNGKARSKDNGPASFEEPSYA